jgi:predicted amidophosphoribosyltransferase
MQIICRVCDQKIDSTAAWCPTCGERLYNPIPWKPIFIVGGAALVIALLFFVLVATRNG